MENKCVILYIGQVKFIIEKSILTENLLLHDFYSFIGKNNFTFPNKDPASFSIIHKIITDHPDNILKDIINHQTYYLLTLVVEDFEYYNLEYYIACDKYSIYETISAKLDNIIFDGYIDVLETVTKQTIN
jgi:hypothetical protein